MAKKKVVVAFSGGLDTSYTVMKLSQDGYEVYAACANTGGFSAEQLKTNEENAYKLGAVKYVTLDVTQEYYEKSLKYMVYGNVLRNNCYPISVSSERIFQAIAIARYANEIGADAIAHGSTGAGNDQIRFDMTFLVMAPGVEIITLTRDGNLSRQEEIDYLNEHGFYAEALTKVLGVYAKDIDVLITEGTNLKKPERCIHEKEVSSKMACIMQAFKYVFVLASSTDIDRLAAIKKAAQSAHKNLYINSAYMKEAMRIFTEREAENYNGLYKFQPRFVTERSLDKMKREGFVLVTGISKMDDVELMRMHLPDNETVLIYSSWDGYYKIPEQVEVNPMYKMFRDSFNNVVDIHTSGHADRDTIKKVIEIVNPKDEVIVIHKEADASLS